MTETSDPTGPVTTPCPHADDDAAYVLGALDPAEQQSFRAHLPSCQRCRDAVAELSVMPGLLARLLPVEQPEAGAPESLLPALVEKIAVERRRARWRARFAGFLAAACLAIVAGFVAVPATPDPDRLLTMSASPGIPVQATLSVTGRGWGTSIDTTCRYDGQADPDSDEGVTYELWAVDDDGGEVLVSSWQQRAGREISVPGSTRLGLEDIAQLEVRNAEGRTILISQL